MKKCERCKKKDKTVSERINPYMEVMYNELVLAIVCDKCYSELEEEIGEDL